MTCNHQCNQGRDCQCRKEETDYMKWQIYTIIAVIFAVGCVAVLVRWAI